MLNFHFCWFNPIIYGLGVKCPLGGQNIKFSYISTIMAIKCPTIGKCWELIGTITLEILLGDIEFARIAYWAPKEQKYQLSIKKGSQGGPKPENQLYLNNYDSVRHKNWQMLRTNWYN